MMKTESKTASSPEAKSASSTREIPSAEGNRIQKIGTCLWFENQAEEAANFYVSLFKNSKITGVSRYSETSANASGQPKGSVMIVTFQLEGRNFMALNGGPVFKHSPAISFIVNCETQDEVDDFWEKLCDGGEPGQCGWLRDKFGVSWQIVPTVLGELMKRGEARKTERMMKALIGMNKLDIATLRREYEKG